MGVAYTLDGRGDIPRVKRRRAYAQDTAATAPSLSSAGASVATQVALTYGENMAGTNLGGWKVLVDSSEVAVTGVSISTVTVTLTVNATMTSGSVIKVWYDSGNADANLAAADDGAWASSIEDQAVTNTIP